MAINTNVYGTSEQWIDSSFNRYITDKNKVAYFAANQSRLENGVAMGKLSYSEPIDKSLSYCGLGTESALSHVGWIWLDEDTNTYKIEEWQDRDITNFAFFQQNDSNIDMSLSPDQLDYTTPMSRGLFWQELQSSWNHNKYLQPYTVINPNNLVLLIRIYATNASANATVDVDFDTYFREHKTNYPNIIHAYYVPYFNNQQWTPTNPVRTVSGEQETSINTNKRTLCYGQLDNYNPVGKDWDFYSYYFINNVFFGYYSRTSFSIYGKKMAFVFAAENAKNHVQILTTGGDNDYRLPTIQYYDGIENDILKSIACFGLYFTTSASVATNGKLTNNDMYIGLLDNNGIGHGQYLRGADTANAPQNNYTDMTQSGYDYTKEVDKTKYINDTQFNTSLSLGAFTKFYQLTESQVNDLCTALYTAVNAQPSGTPIEEYNMKCFLTNNPIDCIISLKKFPLNHFPSVAGTIDDVYLGTVDSGINAPRVLSTTWVYYFDFSNSNDTGLYPVNGGDFRDYEPYTTVQINVPFCGSFEVPTTYFYKYDGVRVALMIDFVSGACTAYLIVNGDVVDSVSGACAVDLPVTGLQSATLDGNIHSAAMSEKSAQTSGTLSMVAGAISIGAGIVTGNPLLAIGGVTALVGGATSLEKNQSQIDYDVQHMQLPLKQVGAASGAIAQCGDYRCKMIIKRPVMLDYNDEVYSTTIGYACLLNGNVSNFHGLTYGEIDLTNINCSESEKEMIKSAFASGVYLP